MLHLTLTITLTCQFWFGADVRGRLFLDLRNVRSSIDSSCQAGVVCFLPPVVRMVNFRLANVSQHAHTGADIRFPKAALVQADAETL